MFSVISRTLVGGVILLKRSSGCILRSQPIRPSRTLVGGVLVHNKNEVDVFCSSSRLGHPGDSMGESDLTTEIQSYSAAPADWAIHDTRRGSLSSLLKCSRCILQPQPTGPSKTLEGGVLVHCWNAVDVFCNSSRLGHPRHSKGESYLTAEMQSNSAAPADWAIIDIKSICH